jgi:DoxX-like family
MNFVQPRRQTFKAHFSLRNPMNTATFSAPSVPASTSTSPSRAAKITGWVLTGLAVAFLTFDTVLKLTQNSAAIESSAELGFNASDVLRFGILELVLLIAYVFPRTSILGAVLWTGYLGGAIAIHTRLGNPLFSHILFPTYVGSMLWGGLWLRETRLQALFPWRRA